MSAGTVHVSNAAVEAYEAAHAKVWRDRAPTTQGEATTVAREAVRAGLAAALPLVQAGLAAALPLVQAGLAAALPLVQAGIAAPVVVEHAIELAGGGMQVRPNDREIERIFSRRDWIRANQRDGGRVHRRKVVIIDDWREVER